MDKRECGEQLHSLAMQLPVVVGTPIRSHPKASRLLASRGLHWRLLHWCDRPRRRGRLGWTQVAGGPLRAQVRRANLACFEDGACFSALAFEQAI